MRITLKVTAEVHKGRVFTFVGHDTFIVGRSDRAHFQLPEKDRYFSRVHFLVEVNPPHIRLMDLASRNGTWVNGKRVMVADLRHGDKIKGGRTVLRVSIEGEATPRTDQPAAPHPGPDAAAAPKAMAAVVAEPAHPQPPPAPCAVPKAVPPAEPTPVSRHEAQPSKAEPCPVCRAAPTPAEALAPVDPSEKCTANLCPACRKAVHDHEQPFPAYLIVRELGRGGMGVVYLALRKVDGAVVALKTIIPAAPATPVLVEQFLREARILGGLKHPNIVAFREMGEVNGRLYFEMDYVRGIDAAQLQEGQGGRLEVGRAVGLICQLLGALEYAHAKGFVHRDIKPANLLVTQVDGREVVKLADFGLARCYQASTLSGLTVTGAFGGTIPYMAPEQITNYRDAKPAVDQYSAGATLYKLLTDHFIYDFPQQREKQLLMILQKDPVPIQSRRSDIPDGLVKIIHRSLAREPKDRYGNVKAMRESLVGREASIGGLEWSLPT